MERGEARAAQAAGWIGFDESRSLFGGVAEPTTAVDLQDGVMISDAMTAMRRSGQNLQMAVWTTFTSG